MHALQQATRAEVRTPDFLERWNCKKDVTESFSILYCLFPVLSGTSVVSSDDPPARPDTHRPSVTEGTASAYFAQQGASTLHPTMSDEAPVLDTGDTAWILTSCCLVFCMTVPGLAIYYAGALCQPINFLSVLTQTLAIVCLITILWLAVGYSIAFNTDVAGILGMPTWFLSQVTMEPLPGTSIPEPVFVMYQLTFAAITPSLILGGTAERVEFGALVLFMALWSIFCYCPVAHWVWSGGWLFEYGFLDFAGGTVVHLNSAMAAVVFALFLGQRSWRRPGLGRSASRRVLFVQRVRERSKLFLGVSKSKEEGEKADDVEMEDVPPAKKGHHGMVHAPAPSSEKTYMVFVGGTLLWFGWFGFNAGSALHANSNASLAMFNSMVSASMGGLLWIFLDKIFSRKPQVNGLVNGVVTGLVAITPACGFVGPAGAIIIGVAGVGATFTMLNRAPFAKWLDDGDVLGMHGLSGVIGTMLCPLLNTVGSLAPSEMPNELGMQIGVQLMGVCAVALYGLVCSTLILLFISCFMNLRVDYRAEKTGLDVHTHGEPEHWSVSREATRMSSGGSQLHPTDDELGADNEALRNRAVHAENTMAASLNITGEAGPSEEEKGAGSS
eukprot:g79478.t1